MTDRPTAGRKLFTVEEANATLPLVQRIVEDVAAVSQDIVERRERLAQIKNGRRSAANDAYSEELAQIEDELEKERVRFYEFADELRELGVELKDGLAGLVDFPSRMDDRVVYLCWKLGEPEVLHWHELDSGFSGRRTLTAGAGAASEGESAASDDDAWRGFDYDQVGDARRGLQKASRGLQCRDCSLELFPALPMSAYTVAAYSLLFVVVGAVFLAANLILGRLLRPKLPNEEKLSVYECGEPTIGSSFVQFDLRFYVVALLFIIFDVEVAFFFPWATTFGKATHLMDPKFAVVQTESAPPQLTPNAVRIYREMGVVEPTIPAPGKSIAENEQQIHDSARLLAKTSIFDILVFFAVLMVGFAYVWSRGDIDWVRAVADERSQPTLRVAAVDEGSETALAG